MLGIHTTILTKSKPWTTISGDYQGDVYNLLHISKVGLVYLGQDQYAHLWKKAVPEGNSYVGPSFNYAPMVNLPAPPTEEELHTAHTLLELHGNEPDSKDSNRDTNTTMFRELLYDAMNKVVEHHDTCLIDQLNVPDAMDSISESTQSDQTPVLHVEMVTLIPEIDQLPALHVETKPCSVNLTRLELILADDLLKVPPTAALDLPVGEHFTRSRSALVTRRTGRKPRRANTGVKYSEIPNVADTPVPSKPKPATTKPNRSGPTQDRINSQNMSSVV